MGIGASSFLSEQGCADLMVLIRLVRRYLE